MRRRNAVWLFAPGPYNASAMMSWVVRGMEAAFVVIMLVLFTGATGMYFHSGNASGVEGNSLAQALFGGAYLIALVLSLLRPSRTLRLLGSEPLLIGVVAIALLSNAWAVDPELATRRSFALIGTTIFGVYLAGRFDVEKTLKLIGWACMVMVAANIVAAMVLPSQSVMHDAASGAWRGTFDHKNGLGRGMAISVLALTTLVHQLRIPRGLPFLLGLVTALSFLLLSQSVTSWVATCVIVALFPILRPLRSRKTVLVAATIGALIVVGFGANYLWSNAAEVARFMGRDVTLTGRTQLWSLSLQAALERPWFGYGYSSFWSSSNPAALSIRTALAWDAPHAHNGVLDLVLTIGAVGMGLFGLLLWKSLARAVRLFRREPGPKGYWPLLFFTLLLLVNLTENTFMVRNNIFWVLQVAVALQLAEQAIERPSLPAAPSDQQSSRGRT